MLEYGPDMPDFLRYLTEIEARAVIDLINEQSAKLDETISQHIQQKSVYEGYLKWKHGPKPQPKLDNFSQSAKIDCLVQMMNALSQKTEELTNKVDKIQRTLEYEAEVRAAFEQKAQGIPPVLPPHVRRPVEKNEISPVEGSFRHVAGFTHPQLWNPNT